MLNSIKTEELKNLFTITRVKSYWEKEIFVARAFFAT